MPRLNTEKRWAYKKAWRQAHLEEIKARDKAYDKTHPEKRKAYDKAYNKAHPEKMRASSMLRRARKRGTATEAVDYELIRKQSKMICGICGKKVRPQELSFDHIIPLSKGGAHATWNLQVSHLCCNLRRGPGRTPGSPRLAL